MYRTLHSCVILLGLITLCSSQCADGYDELHGKCRFVYAGVFSQGDERVTEFGTGYSAAHPAIITLSKSYNITYGVGSSLVTDDGVVLKQNGNEYIEQKKKIPVKKVVLSGDVFLDESGYLRDCRNNASNCESLPNITDFQGYLYSRNDNNVFRIISYDATPLHSICIFNGSLYALGNENITNVYDSYEKEGLYHYAIILSNKTLLMGGNNNDYQLGAPHNDPIEGLYNPLPGVPIIHAALSHDFTIVQAENGSFFQWGDVDIYDEKKPRLLQIPNVKISKVMVGLDHVLLLTDTGVVMAWGDNNYGQLADGTKISKYTPVIYAPSKKERVLLVVPTATSTFIVFERRVEVWGFPNRGTYYRTEKTEILKKMIQTSFGKVKSIQSGYGFSLLLTEDGNLFATGANDFGQLGIGTSSTSYIPNKVVFNDIMYSSEIDRIYTIRQGSAMVTKDNRLYAWGRFCFPNYKTLNPTYVNFSIGVQNIVAAPKNNFYLFGNDSNIYTCNESKIVQVENHYKIDFFDTLVYSSSWYAKLKNGSILLIQVPLEVQNLVPMTVLPSQLFSSTCNCTIDAMLYISECGYKQVHSIALYNKNGTYSLIVVCNNGNSYISESRGFKPYEKVNINLTNSEILALANNTFEVNHFTAIIRHVIPPDTLKRAVTVAVTSVGITGVFHSCSEFFTGPECDVPICGGKSALNESVCHSRGKCTKPNNCTCEVSKNGTISGEDCEIFLCSPLYTGQYCELPSPSFVALVTIVGGIPGICLLLCTIILVSLYACRYKRVVVKQKHKEYEMENMLRVSLINADSLAAQIDRDWVIPLTDLVFSEIISEGSFGVVFKGVYQNLDVAIKVTKDVEGNTEDLEQEIRILRSLRHPNIVLFMGVALNDKTRYIVTELMLGNSLDALIHQHKPASLRNQLHVSLQFSKKVELLRDVIKGMIYLHGLTPSIVHRDLKPSNILLDKHLQTCKVCDFGTAKTNTTKMTGNIGTVLYMSPEVLRDEVVLETSTKTDVFSFGIIMYEVFFEKVPYSELNNCSSLGLSRRISKGYRPVIPEGIFNNASEAERQYLQLMQDCWVKEPTLRPSFEKIYDLFITIKI